MKRSVIALLIFLIVYIGAAFLLPTERSYIFRADLPVPSPAILRLLTDTAQTDKWWPGGRSGGTDLTWNSYRYHIKETFYSRIVLKCSQDDIQSMMSLDVTGNHTNASTLTCTIQSSSSRSWWGRPLHYWSLARLESEQRLLMDSISAFLGDPDRVYGFRIEEQRVTDATLLSVRKPFDHYPATPEIYEMLDSVRQRITELGGRSTNQPMLNIYPGEAGGLEAMTAIATDRELNITLPYSLKRMLPNGKILVAEVRGGPASIRNCQEAVEAYVRDRGLLSPAMSFQRLITDRRANPDTGQWVTTINYPIF